ncbi:MAG TPA: FKBP-type peptidyl-prolyl cis-trans isomerase [Phycisphaerales bacterium]
MKRNLWILLGVSVSAALVLAACQSKPASPPASDQPATESQPAPSTQEAPKQEAPKQEATKQEPPKQEAPKQEAPKQEAPKQEAPKPAAPAPTKPEEKKPDAAKPQAKADEPKKEEAKKEEAKKEEPKPAVTFLNSDKAEPLATKKLDSGVIVEDLKLGEGSECKPGATVTINYHGTLKDGGTMFDTTRGKQPATFPLNRLIKGWQQGVPGMKPGGIRRLTIPYAQAYGENGRPPVIPAKADLVFIIELIGVVEPAK